MFSLDRYPNLVAPVILFLAAFFFSVHGTSLVRWLAVRLRLFDQPDARRAHTTPVPRLGGLAIVLACFAAMLLAFFLSDQLSLARSPALRVVMAVSAGIAAVGLIDDLRGVPAWAKLLALAVACLVLQHYGIGINRTPYTPVNFALTFLWVAGVSSALNAVDNSDGLAGCVAVISGVTLFLMGWRTWQPAFSLLAMAMAGSVLGFLHHNMRPARIFMGDAGSFFLGFLLAVLVVFGEWSPNPWQALFGGCMVIALPAYDLGLTTLLRVRHGVVRNLAEAIAHSDTDHLAHRLRALGWSHDRMLLALCSLHGLCCLAGTSMGGTPRAWKWTMPGVMAVALVALAWWIDRRTSKPSLWRAGRPAAAPAPTTGESGR